MEVDWERLAGRLGEVPIEEWTTKRAGFNSRYDIYTCVLSTGEQIYLGHAVNLGSPNKDHIQFRILSPPLRMLFTEEPQRICVYETDFPLDANLPNTTAQALDQLCRGFQERAKVYNRKLKETAKREAQKNIADWLSSP